jgi:hypothetical protein
MNLSSIRKTVINVLTILVTAGPWILKAMNVFPGTNGTVVATLLSSVLGFAAVALHYLVPNTTTDPLVAANQSVKLVAPARGTTA